MLKVHLSLSYQPATSLIKNQLPADHLTIFPAVDEDPHKINTLQEEISNFNLTGDRVLTDVFSPLYSEEEFGFCVVSTSGVPAPYDAWTRSIEGKPVIFFNLSEWTIEELKKQGLAVIIHEVTHALLEPFLKNFPSHSLLDNLNKIVFDEGIAHFMGFPGNRSSLLEKYPEKWLQSEAQLEHAIKKIESHQLTTQEKEDLLSKANTGPFWEKYGAISGMFRAAKIYSCTGANGLIKAIKNSQLPRDRFSI